MNLISKFYFTYLMCRAINACRCLRAFSRPPTTTPAASASSPTSTAASDATSSREQKLLRELLETHERLTGSRVARSLLRFDRHLAGFCRITPVMAAAIAPMVETEAEPVAEAV